MVKAKKKTTKAPATYPYVHVGHGVSAARKDWGLLVVLREPLAGALGDEAAPAPIDTVEAKRGQRTIHLAHTADSLQWVVAATYEGAGPRADKGEATEAQWKAFNAELDDYLARIHARAPIAVVIRPVDGEYSTDLSPWHAWSCRALPALLPTLDAALGKSKVNRWFLEEACDLWRAWVAEHSGPEQARTLAALDTAAQSVLKKNGGIPEAEEQEEEPAEPTLEEQFRAWKKVGRGADPHVFSLGLLDFVQALSESKSAAHDQLIAEIVPRAIASPRCEWPDTHWRPELVRALVRLGRMADAKREIARVVTGAESYMDANWEAIIAYLDRAKRHADADAIQRLAERYVTGFEVDRKAGRVTDGKARVARIFLELSEPIRKDFDALDDEALSHTAFLFEDMVKEGVADASLFAEAKRARARFAARKVERIARGREKLARGEKMDAPTLKALAESIDAKNMKLADAERFARAALVHEDLIESVERLAYGAKDENPKVALLLYRAILEVDIPAEGSDARASWLQVANAALVLTHAQKLYAESERLADRVTQYARENSYITHSAACSYAAVKRYDDAFAQAKLAVEVGYDYVDRLRKDKDLGPLLKRPDFQALFAKEKKRRR